LHRVIVIMAYQPASHYQTSSLSHPANSPFGRTAQLNGANTIGQYNPNSTIPFQPSASSSPFSVRPELDPLEREKREVERRRARLDDRKTRILHAKTRVMGVDVEALNEQVRERQERERLEAERELYHDDLSTYHSKVLSGLEEERKIKERIQKEELTFYRQQQANEKRAREQRSASGWENMQDARTSFLSFTGEDREKALRDKAQRDQQKDWLAQQLAIQSDKEARERQDEADHAQHQSRILEMKLQNEADQQAAAIARNKATQEYNQQVAAQKANARARFATQNHHSNASELSLTLSSALLNETVAPSALGDHRTIPYHFKGFSSQQRQAILDAQAAQQAALQQKRVSERLEEKDYALQSELIRREMLRVDRQKEEHERQRLLALKEERFHQQKQKTLRDQYHNNVVYTNPVSEEFFQQFGTSGR
jgi:hypothetical protein